MTEPLRGFFVTGTDTGVGKTLVSQVMLHQLCADYRRVAGFKPVASGCESTPEGLRNADAVALQRAGSMNLPYDVVNPYAFAAPVAPHLAAQRAGVIIDCNAIVQSIAAVRADCVVVEGVGGWLVPLNDHQTTADLAQMLALPVMLVVGLRLGCLNHALLTAEAIRARGLEIAGWIANQIDPQFDLGDENVAALEQRLQAPLTMRLPYFPHPQLPKDVAASCRIMPSVKPRI